MLNNIIELLQFAEMGKSEVIDIALGKYKVPMGFKDIKKLLKWRKT